MIGHLKMLTVVAAVMQRDGRVLICQRRKNDPFGLKWEFPGGKLHADETPQAALARELREELDVVVVIGEELYRTRHRYREYPEELELIFFAARLEDAAARNLAFEHILWAEPTELPGYDFLEADREFITKLAAGAVRLP